MNITDFELFKQNAYTPFYNNGNEYLLNREPYLDVILTDACNSNCGFCIADLIHQKLNLDFEIAKQKIEFAIKYMHVKDCLLLGGEPTVSKLLIPMIEYLKTLPLDKILMTTNGIRLARNEAFRELVFGAGLTHVNISFMNLDHAKQVSVTNQLNTITLEDIVNISKTARKYGVKVRINNNIFNGNNDTLADVMTFYEELMPYVDSIKFSPLLKVSSFSVIDVKIQWVRKNIMTDAQYDCLFKNIEDYYSYKYNLSVITNEEQFGFVKNSMIPMRVPILLNWNQHGKMMKKVVEEHKINNLKLLPNNELSLSWNRELTQYFINTDEDVELNELRHTKLVEV